MCGIIFESQGYIQIFELMIYFCIYVLVMRVRVWVELWTAWRLMGFKFKESIEHVVIPSSPSISIASQVYTEDGLILWVVTYLLHITDFVCIVYFINFILQIRPWLTSLGFSLCFGTIMAKMARVFYIFHNPKLQKKPPVCMCLFIPNLLMSAAVACDKQLAPLWIISGGGRGGGRGNLLYNWLMWTLIWKILWQFQNVKIVE